MKTVKKIFCMLLCAAFVVPAAACNNDADKKNQSSSETSVSSKAESSMTYEMIVSELDPDENVKKKIEENIDVEKLGKKTQEALKVIENKSYTITMEFEVEADEESKASDEESLSMSDVMDMMDGSKITILRKGEDLGRVTIDIGSMMGMDRLQTENGTYNMNTKRKTATKIDEKNTGDIKDTLKLMGLDVDVDTIMDETSTALENSEASELKENTKYELIGEGTEKFKGSELSYEEYKVTGKKSATLMKKYSKNSDASGDETIESTFRLYFDGNSLKYMVSGDEKSKVIVKFKEYYPSVDESKLEIPSNYKIIESKSST